MLFLFNIFNVFYLNIAHNSISITSHIAAYKNVKNVEKPRRTTDGLPKKQIQTVETENWRVPNLPKQHLKKGNTNTSGFFFFLFGMHVFSKKQSIMHKRKASVAFNPHEQKEHVAISG